MEKVKRTPASLKKMVEIFGMEILHKGRDFDNTVVTISDVNRPALQLVGFYDYFDDKRLQILGRGEMRYLDRMTEAERTRVFNKLLSYPFPALINSDHAGNFAGTQAPGTNIYMARRAVDHCLHALDIGLPGTIGTPVGVRDLDTEGHALVAKFALSHPLHLLAVYDLLLCFRKHVVV